MAENLSWLFAAFAIGFGILFAYLFWMSRKEQELRKRVATLEELLRERD